MIRLHHCHGTRSMRTLWLLNELGVPFEVAVYPFDDTLHSDAYRALNPIGRVPALEIDGEVMTESGAMAEMLTERFPEAGLGRGLDDPDRMDWLQWLHFAETVSSHVQTLTQQHIALREDWMRSPTVMKVEAKRLGRCYAAIEARLSTPVENRDYLLTSGFSAADIGVGQAVWMGLHFARLDGFPETRAWMDRLMARPAFQAALPPEEAEMLYAQDFYEPWPEPKSLPARKK